MTRLTITTVIFVAAVSKFRQPPEFFSNVKFNAAISIRRTIPILAVAGIGRLRFKCTIHNSRAHRIAEHVNRSAKPVQQPIDRNNQTDEFQR